MPSEHFASAAPPPASSVLKERIFNGEYQQTPTQSVPYQLLPGSTFSGSQKSGKTSYHVLIEIQHINLEDSLLCGYLKIKGLTGTLAALTADDWPHLCTFFEGEIIGPKHKFLTRKWDADQSIDLQHWTKFPSFKTNPEILSRQASVSDDRFNDDSYVYDYQNSDYIYMRWKVARLASPQEHFLVPDHKIKSISGASFAGFYYIVFQKSTATIQGIYFHQNSEWFQQLSLSHVPSLNFSSFEFR
ncbi:hypothetical protein HDU91_003189 [Kappamyces sp. JEL0680]|nr:hypothetical protein HDU91_003189 [Kappamyces sp. JEL0680]